ncbi:MAG: site-specific recombinase [Patescibacteria group bacterium]|nr:site-specific recombinase [Patescibacteria group bacterium]
MSPTSQPRIGLLAIRVSSDKQGLDGDSPEAQREQGESYAKAHNIIITETIILLESASHEEQPMQKVIDACKDKSKGFQVVLIKSIDRFTRGGGDHYSPLKRQLTFMNIALEDMYGVIGKAQVNTLEHTGFKYYWSEFNPTQKSEYLEAERAKDEMRDIMSRMIGAEIRYTQLGYWMRQPQFGFYSKPIDTRNGKRLILKPHKDESKYVIRLFEMRASHMYTNQQIADELNSMGFCTRKTVVRDKYDRTKIRKQIGGKKMTTKMIDRYVSKLIYCGVICEKWTYGKPVKAQFDGLVSVDMFNEANRGRLYVEIDSRNEVTVKEKTVPEHLKTKQVYNSDYPYKQAVACPKCGKSLSGSATRGKKGVYYPAYHCARDGHYFRVPKPEFDQTIEDFVRAITIKPEYIDNVIIAIGELWRERQSKQIEANQQRIEQRECLKSQIRATVDRMRVITSETALKYLEEDVVGAEKEITRLDEEIAKQPDLQAEFDQVLQYAKYILEHLSEMLLDLCNPLRKAAFFGAIFNKIPTYAEIDLRTHENSSLPEVNELFMIRTILKSTCGDLTGNRTRIARMRTWCPNR